MDPDSAKQLKETAWDDPGVTPEDTAHTNLRGAAAYRRLVTTAKLLAHIKAEHNMSGKMLEKVQGLMQVSFNLGYLQCLESVSSTHAALSRDQAPPPLLTTPPLLFTASTGKLMKLASLPISYEDTDTVREEIRILMCVKCPKCMRLPCLESDLSTRENLFCGLRQPYAFQGPPCMGMIAFKNRFGTITPFFKSSMISLLDQIDIALESVDLWDALEMRHKYMKEHSKGMDAEGNEYSKFFWLAPI